MRLALSKELLNTSFTPRLSAGRPGKPRQAAGGLSRPPHCRNEAAGCGRRENSPARIGLRCLLCAFPKTERLPPSQLSSHP